MLYWGGRNGSLRFRGHDRSGGWKYRKTHWKRFVDVCGDYTGPDLVYLVSACTAPDGSHWALQEWMRETPNYGGVSGPRELRLSHFTGQPATLWISTDWSWNGRYLHMWGTYTYQGKPVMAFDYTPTGYVLDRKGRNIAVDSWNSDYGPGWRRVNAFLAHQPSGQFCYGFSPKVEGRPETGRSTEEWYRATVVGPGVSPDIQQYFRGQLGGYNQQIDENANYWQGVLSNWATSGSCSKRN